MSKELIPPVGTTVAPSNKTRWRIVSLIAIVASLFVIAAILVNALNDLSRRALASREALRAKSVAASLPFVAEIQRSASWAFISPQQINDLAQPAVGMRFSYQGKNSRLTGTTVEITALNVQTMVGEACANLSLTAKQGNRAVELQCEADIVSAGIESDGKQTLLGFHFVPTDFALRVVPGWLDIPRRSLASALLADAAFLKALPDLGRFVIPLPSSFEVPLEKMRVSQQRVPIDSGNGYLTLDGGFPLQSLKMDLPLVGVAFGPQGLFVISANLKESPETKLPTYQQEILLAKYFAKVNLPAGTATAVFLGKENFERVEARLNKLTPADRTATISVTDAQGKLAGVSAYRDDVLGSGDVNVELHDITSTKLTAAFGTFSSHWDASGLTLRAPLDLSFHGAVHLMLNVSFAHLGTTMGVTGGAKTNLTLHTVPQLIDSPAGKVAAVALEAGDDAFDLSAMTDGRLEVGPAHLDVIGVGLRFRSAINNLVQPAFAVLMEPTETPYENKEIETEEGWKAQLANPAVVIALTPDACVARADGLFLSAHLHATPQTKESYRDFDALREEVARENAAVSEVVNTRLSELLAARGVNSGEQSLALLVGNLEFGPNNDIVKALKLIVSLGGQLTKAGIEALDKAGQTATHVVDSVGHEVWKIETKPLQAATDLPGNVGRELQKGYDNLGLKNTPIIGGLF